MKKIAFSFLILIICVQSSAQSLLTVDCYVDQSQAALNGIYVDNNQVEYGLCSANPSFYVAIFDTSCQVWGTRYNGQNPQNDFGNMNDGGACRQRSENYFIYTQNNSNQLIYLDSLLNFWIPNNHAIALYTPLSYDFSLVDSICPQLGATLVSKWGPMAKSSSISVFFGEQGNPSSFSVDTLMAGDNSVSILKNICGLSNLGLNKLEKNTESELLMIVDALGRECEEKANTLLIYVYRDGTTKRVLRVE
jgi:hypothetical protein